MANLIAYSTVDDQLQKLKDQKLIIRDDSSAKQRLSTFGYTSLIKGYRRPYTITVNGDLYYRSDVTFEQIVSLYMLDKNLRNAVIAAMLDLEEHVKEALADVIAQSFGVDHNSYLAFRNFRNKRKRNPKFSLTNLLLDINKPIQTPRDPIKHYLNKYGIVPPWILLKIQFMGIIVNLVDQLKRPEQEMLFRKLYPSFSGPVTSDMIHLMTDTLFVCYEYRNIAAHGGRIYNHSCNAHVRPVNGLTINQPGFSQLLQLLDLIDYKGPYHYLSAVLNNEVNRHCSSYPQDVTYLSMTMNMNIQAQNIVWITTNSKKYHTIPHCSGIRNPVRMEFEKAEAQGYSPCKRCCI